MGFFESLPVERFPHMHAMAALLTHGSGDQRERFGIEVLLNGLLATHRRPPGSFQPSGWGSSATKAGATIRT